MRARSAGSPAGGRAQAPGKEWPVQQRANPTSVGMARGQRPPPRRDTTRSRRRARGNVSQGQEAARDHIFGLAHAEYLDELASVLESTEVRPVVDDLLRECSGETGQRLQLINGGGVEIGAGDDRP